MNKDKPTLRLFYVRRPYAMGSNEQGLYLDYFLEEIVNDIVHQDKVKQFARLWDKKVVYPNQTKLL